MTDSRIDLHTHSTCSDGSLAPADLVAAAAAAGITVLALTDHDSVDGLECAQLAARASSLVLVPGVEISATFRAQNIHILGLWINPDEPRLRAQLGTQAQRRRERMERICARLEKRGLPGGALLADVQQAAGIATRTHLARAMVSRGVVATPEEAFRKYLRKGQTGHVAAEWPPVAETVRWIREAGGVAALAHPIRYSLSSGARRALLEEFATAGGTALEVVSGANGRQHVETCAMLARRFGLEGSVGSDFHDPQHVWNPLGRSLKLPDFVTPVWRQFGI